MKIPVTLKYLFIILFSNSLFSQSESIKKPDLVVEMDYEYVKSFSHYRIIKKNSKFGVLNIKTGKIDIPLVYDNIRNINGTDSILIVTTKNINDEYSILIDLKNNFLSKKYSQIDFSLLNNKLIAKTMCNNVCLYIMLDVKGNEVSENFEKIDYQYAINAYKIMKNGKYGIIDENLKIQIPSIYEDININQYGRSSDEALKTFLIAKKDGKYGVISMLNKVLIPFQYNAIYSKCGLNYIVLIDQKTQIINNKNQIIANGVAFDEINCPDLLNNYTVKEDRKWGLMNGNGQLVLPIEYENIHYDKVLNKYVVKKHHYSGLADEEGKIIIPIEYKGFKVILNNAYSKKVVYNQIDRLIAVKNNLYGIINLQNKIVIPIEYQSIELYVTKDMLEDFKNENPKLIYGQKFYKVSKNNESFIINENNEIVNDIN